MLRAPFADRKVLPSPSEVVYQLSKCLPTSTCIHFIHSCMFIPLNKVSLQPDVRPYRAEWQHIDDAAKFKSSYSSKYEIMSPSFLAVHNGVQ